MRYLGQWRSLRSPSAVAGRRSTRRSQRFHAEHEREYTYRRDDAPVEIYRLSVRAIGVTPKPELARHDADGGAPEPAERARRPLRRGEARSTTPVYARDDLPAGARFEGPAVIDQLDSTTLVPPGVKAEVDEWLNIRMQIEQEDES